MLERKAFRFHVKSIDEAGVFEGYASTFGNEDSYGDIIHPGAFKASIESRGGVFPMLWQHNPEEPIGASIEMGEDDYGLAVRGKINLDVQRGREARALLAQPGALGGFSIGFYPEESTPRKSDRVPWPGRDLKVVSLVEFSAVTFPANEMATLTAIKGDPRDAVRRLVAFAEAEQKAGRVLSAANRAMVESAIEALTALLAAADPAVNDDDDEKALREFLAELRASV